MRDLECETERGSARMRDYVSESERVRNIQVPVPVPVQNTIFAHSNMARNIMQMSNKCTKVWRCFVEVFRNKLKGSLFFIFLFVSPK